MQNNPYVLRVANASGYENNVLQDNDIPNKKYITNYVAASNGVATVDRLYYPPIGTIDGAFSSIQAFASSIVFQIPKGTTKAIISSSGLTVNNVNLYNDTVTNVGSNNLKLTATNNNVEINAILNLDDQSSTPSPISGTSKIYSSATAGTGKTGLFFTNVNNTDELISKNRAVLFSILL
jgi:hypothetical protein